MKPLLVKTTTLFLIYVLVILVTSIPVYYVVVDAIWKGELDDHNKTVVEKTAYEFNHLKLSNDALMENMALLQRIQPDINIKEVSKGSWVEDHYFTIERQKTFSAKPEIERYRTLQKVVYINSRPFLFTIETNIEESEETIAAITATTVFFFLMIVVGVLLINRRLSKTVWEPFRRTLVQLKSFNLNKNHFIKFEKSDIKEFEDLHVSLQKLIDQNIKVYQTQKQFTENASHELQTPLAIIKNKLDLLLQNDDLTEKQYHIVEEINLALSRSSRINKNLLLLAKIENSQFDNSQKIDLDTTVLQSIELFESLYEEKNIKINYDLKNGLSIYGNQSLIEILVNNLLINAVRHTDSQGEIVVKLSENTLEIANTGSQKLNNDDLFKRFSRLSTDNFGSGLGLSIVQEICKFHKWEIAYDFRENKHIFIIYFQS